MFSHRQKISRPNIKADFPADLEAKWFSGSLTEGQLLVDVLNDKDNIIVKAAMAGVRPENLRISLREDLLTIRGYRSSDIEADNSNYLYRECYWGAFSRSLVLPAEVDSRKVESFLENGVLTIILKKREKYRMVEVKIKS